MFVSCIQWGSRENNRLMNEAQLLVEIMPESALIFLDSMNTVLFSKSEKAIYTLLRIQAKENAGLNLSTDIEIFQVRDFFIQKKDWVKAALACYYAGKVVDYMDNVALETDYYLEGLEYAKKTNNELLQGKILYNMGFLKFDKIWESDDITRYQLALSIYQTSKFPHQHEIYLLISIGHMFIVEQKPDSAQHYFNVALDIAKSHDDHTMQALTYNKIMEACIEIGLFDTAKYYGRQALNLATTDMEKADIYKNLANIFYQESIIDSARYYIVKAESFFADIENRYELADFYHICYEIEKKSGNMSKALEYFELYAQNRIEHTNRNDFHKLLEYQKKHETAEKERNFYREKRGIWRWIGLISIVFLFLVFSIVALRNKIKLQEMVLKISKKEKEEVKSQLEEQQINYQKRNKDFQTLFLEKLGVIKELSILNTHQRSTTNIAFDINALKSKLTLQNFIEIINNLYPGFTVKLKNAFPGINLSEREIGICCLIVCGFSNKELSLFIYNQKGTNTIQKWKTRFRKKLNIPEYGNIRSFLLEKIAQCE
jgi:tetratricopeptide (TPR) repeat protein